MSNDDLFQLWVDKGQGMKALKSVYQQGREDKYQEITSEYMLLTETQVVEIRADAIEEYKNALHKEFEKADKKLFHWLDFVEMYNKVAEQLKENTE